MTLGEQPDLLKQFCIRLRNKQKPHELEMSIYDDLVRMCMLMRRDEIRRCYVLDDIQAVRLKPETRSFLHEITKEKKDT